MSDTPKYGTRAVTVTPTPSPVTGRTAPVLQDSPLVLSLEERQKRVLARLPGFAKVSILTAGLAFSATTVIQGIMDPPIAKQFGLPSPLSSLTIGTFVAVLLAAFSAVTTWLFVIWSLTFIPFLGYHTYKAAQQAAVPVGTRGLRWIQLYTCTFLPMAVFAAAWNSLATVHPGRASISGIDLLLILVGAAIVAALLWFTNRIPIKLVALRLSVLSIMLYASLFLTYGLGYSTAAHSALFGILGYLTFGLGDLEELGRRVMMYDVDPAVADRLFDLQTRRQLVRTRGDELVVQRMEHQQSTKAAQIDNESRLGTQLTKISEARTHFNQRTNETMLMMLEKHQKMLGDMHAILTEEFSRKMEEEIPRRIAALRQKAPMLSPGELAAEMKLIIGEINKMVGDVPTGLDSLRDRMLQITSEMETTTRRLAQEASHGDDEA